MKIDVPGCFAVEWLCALPQDWPSGRCRSPGPSALAIRLGCLPGAVRPCRLLDKLAVCRRSADLDGRLDAGTSR
jgi:hypothetical protein